MSSNPVAELRDVSYRYPETARPALTGVDWTIEAGTFVLVAGPSGSGKSTMLRCLNGLVPHFSGGEFGGQVLVLGHDTRQAGTRVLSQHVGFVFQDPEAQLVTTRVDDELAFGMEQLAVPPLTMRKRVEEVLDLLGIAHLRHRDVATLSGGERQRVAVAAALALHPTLLVLDEPTSQLDPWGAEEVLTALSRLNEDLGITIVLAEHRLDRVAAHADRLRAILPGSAHPATPVSRTHRTDSAHPAGLANLAAPADQPDLAMPAMIDGEPRAVLAQMDPGFLPPLVQVGRRRGWQPLPLTIKEGRAAVRREQAAGQGTLPPAPAGATGATGATGAPLLTLQRVSAGYEDVTILRELDLEARPGEIIALMGRNGSGKTTLLRLLMGLHRPRRGRITLFGRDTAGLDPATIGRDAGYVPQNPGSLLFAETLRDELAFTLAHHPDSRLDSQTLLDRLGLGDHLLTHPRDLSGGERQRAALAAVLIGDPRLLLLDEPTRGMDGRQKRILAEILTGLGAEGRTVVLATHDVELVAATATRVLLLGDGRIVADGPPRQVLSGSLTYTTQVNKLFGGTYLTVADILT